MLFDGLVKTVPVLDAGAASFSFYNNLRERLVRMKFILLVPKSFDRTAFDVLCSLHQWSAGHTMKKNEA